MQPIRCTKPACEAIAKRKKKKKRGSEDESRRSFHSDKTLQAEGQRVQKQHFANGENDEAYFLETVSDLTLGGEAVPGILFRLCPLGGGGRARHHVLLLAWLRWGVPRRRQRSDDRPCSRLSYRVQMVFGFSRHSAFSLLVQRFVPFSLVWFRFCNVVTVCFGFPCRWLSTSDFGFVSFVSWLFCYRRFTPNFVGLATRFGK